MNVEDEKHTQIDDLDNLDESPQASPGDSLCKAREQLGYNRAAVGQQLGLTEKAVKDLERNQFDRFAGALYVRGYLKNYAKLLTINEDDIMVLFDQYCVDNHLDLDKGDSQSAYVNSKPAISPNTGFLLVGIPIIIAVVAVIIMLIS